MEHPTIQQVVNIDLAAPNEEISEEGTRYVYNLAPELDIVKLELVFKAGRKFEWKPLVSKLTANMLKLGTETLSSEAFAEQFEYFGTELKLREGFNFISFSVSFVKRHFETITDLIIQCVTQPLFSETEFDKLKRRLSQQLKVSLKKSDVVAFRLFTEAIFGSDHPYGYNTTNEAIQSVAISDVKDFFGKAYNAANCTVFIHGGLDREDLNRFKQKMTSMQQGEPIQSTSALAVFERKEPLVIRKAISANNIQSSIRIGSRLFARSHKDWNDYYLLNMILGGYFGARLSQNLREKNGMTYGAYSSIETYIDDGYWYIHTDVDKQMVDKAIKEIQFELARLIDFQIDEKELEMVKNYTKGIFLMTIDGIFAQSVVLKDIYLAGLSVTDYNQIIADIEKVDALRLQELARTYWKSSSLVTVIVD